jgi:hypothetical protein
MKPAMSDTSHTDLEVFGATRYVIGVTAVLLLVLGVWPNRALDIAREQGRDLQPDVMVTVSR